MIMCLGFVGTAAAIAMGVLAVGAIATQAYTAKRAGDAEDKAEKQQAQAKAQMESDLYNRNSQQAMRLLRQRILMGRNMKADGLGGSPQGGAQLGGVGLNAGTPYTAPKSALGA